MKKNMRFEEAMSRLEEITAKLGDDTTSLEDSLSLFTEGAELVQFCNKKLDEAQLKIEKCTLLGDAQDE